MNITSILGNLTRDPEKKSGKGGDFYVMSLADNQGKEAVIFWDVVYFGDTSSKIWEWLKKGSAVVVTGEVNPPKTYKKKDGTDGFSMSFTAKSINFSPFKTSKPEDAAPAQASPAAPQQEYNAPF